jgi:transcription elongation factor SPT6
MEEGEALSDDDLGIGVDSMDSSDEEEEEEEEMTEADKKFIAADDEDEEDDIGYRRKKKKRRVDDVDKEEEDILQDELELIHENVGKKKSKLRRKGDKDSLAHIFDDDVEEDEDIADDLDDFIIRDEGEEENEDLLRERKQRKIDRLEFVRNLGSGYGVDDEYLVF